MATRKPTKQRKKVRTVPAREGKRASRSVTKKHLTSKRPVVKRAVKQKVVPAKNARTKNIVIAPRRRTKIVCTIGPASTSRSVLKQMIEAGMDVARLNFSHGTYDQHQGFIDTIRSLSTELRRPITIMQDLQGPKIRIGELPEAGLVLSVGKEWHFSPRAKAYTDAERLIPVTYGGFVRDVQVGDRILIDDGNICCVVTRVHGGVVAAKVTVGGLVTSHKGINLPDSSVRLSALTAKDQQDVAFGVRAGVDVVVLSFVSSADDLHKLRELIKREQKRHGTKSDIAVMAKVERADAVRRIDEIIDAADAVMIGRGDLGVEVPAEQVPLIQKDITRRCRCAGVPVIVATQMLESMREKPRATRAEVSDVANAVIDHADAVMLSAESATGQYPVRAVETLRDIALATEASVYDNVRPDERCVDASDVALAEQIRLEVSNGVLQGIVTSTQFEDVARMVNRHRPEVPIYVAAPDDVTAAQWNLRWGVVPFVLKRVRSSDAFEKAAREQLETDGLVAPKAHLLFMTATEQGPR